MLLVYYIAISLIINVVKIPYDNGANMKGSSQAPDELLQCLDFLQYIIRNFGFLIFFDYQNFNLLMEKKR